jgi:hypothetical protein
LVGSFTQITWTALWVVGLPYMGLALFLMYYMRDNHPSVWDALGQPSFLNNSIANGYRGFRYFILRSDYQSLNDPFLNKLVIVMKSLFAIFFLLFAIAVVAIFRTD